METSHTVLQVPCQAPYIHVLTKCSQPFRERAVGQSSYELSIVLDGSNPTL